MTHIDVPVLLNWKIFLNLQKKINFLMIFDIFYAILLQTKIFFTLTNR